MQFRDRQPRLSFVPGLLGVSRRHSVVAADDRDLSGRVLPDLPVPLADAIGADQDRAVARAAQCGLRTGGTYRESGFRLPESLNVS